MITKPTTHISVMDITGRPTFFRPEDATEIRRRITAAIRRGDHVVLSFAGITYESMGAVGEAVGRLYGKFSEETIARQLTIADSDVPARIAGAIREERAFMKDPKGYRERIREAKRWI